MRRKALRLAAAAFGLGMAACPLMAHHSFAAEYDSTKPTKLTGTVTKVEWMNPHIYYYLDVKDAAGKVTNYAVEGGTPNGLRRQGWGERFAEGRRDRHRPGFPGERRLQPYQRQERNVTGRQTCIWRN